MVRLNRTAKFVATGAFLTLVVMGCSDPATPPLPPTLTDDSQNARAFSGNGLAQTTEAFSVKHELVVAWEFGECPTNASGELTVQVQTSTRSGEFRTIIGHVEAGSGQVLVNDVANRALSLRILNPGGCTWRLRMWPSR